MSLMKENEYPLVISTEIFLGHRADTTRRVKQSLTADIFQYISILETLKFIFCNEEMQSLYLKRVQMESAQLLSFCQA